VETPAAIGLPLMMPPEEPRLSPAGSVPLVTAHVIGVVPAAIRVCEYAAPVTAVDKGEEVTMEGRARFVGTGAVRFVREPPLPRIEEAVAARGDASLMTGSLAVGAMAS
jgi:hypothetical protein